MPFDKNNFEEAKLDLPRNHTEKCNSVFFKSKCLLHMEILGPQLLAWTEPHSTPSAHCKLQSVIVQYGLHNCLLRAHD